MAFADLKAVNVFLLSLFIYYHFILFQLIYLAVIQRRYAATCSAWGRIFAGSFNTSLLLLLMASLPMFVRFPLGAPERDAPYVFLA